MLLGALAVAVALVAALSGMGSGLAQAAVKPGPAVQPASSVKPGSAVSPHVVIVGLSGLRWTDVSASATPALGAMARAGSPGSLVAFAVGPHTCPADAWLTLNGGDRAQAPHTGTGPCPALPAVTVRPGQAGAPGPARVAAMPSLVSYNHTLNYSPRWGLLASAAGPDSCATAVGPGAALALAGPAGHVGSYLPAVAGLSRAVLARCPLTVVDAGSLPGAGGPGGARAAALRHADTEIAAIAAELPAGTTLMVAGLGSSTLPPHLQAIVISGPAYRSGRLDASSTRQAGMVVLTDLTPTVLGWRGQPRPAGLPGSQITRAGRGALAPTLHGLIGQDTAAQVWMSTHEIFFWIYVAVDLVVFIGIGLLFWGGQPDRRRRRAALWRLAGTIVGAVPAGSFLANLVPWWLMPHPAIWQYGLTLVWTAAVSAIALAGPWRRDPFGPAGAVATATVLIVGLDVITGSRLQLGSPFGLSVLDGGRFYGIGGAGIGLYAVCAVIAIAWVGNTLLRSSRPPAVHPHPSDAAPDPRPVAPDPRPVAPVTPAVDPPASHRDPGGLNAGATGHGPGPAGGRGPGGGRGRALAAASAVALFAVIACGWPQFGAKVGGTIAIAPCALLLLMAMAGIRITVRRVALVLGSGVALFAVFALINYLVPATGQSDIGSFAGNLVHGHSGGLLLRKLSSMLGSTSLSPAVPPIIILVGLILLRPSWFAVKAVPRGYAAEPLLAMTLAMMWLVCVLGWFADDSGIAVPANALPLALPLGIALLASVPLADQGAPGRGPAVTGSSVTAALAPSPGRSGGPGQVPGTPGGGHRRRLVAGPLRAAWAGLRDPAVPAVVVGADAEDLGQRPQRREHEVLRPGGR